ncbi:MULTISPECIES: hypothetical protein [unclassified Brenneria]|uniref:hypothetical protein n=1 Tax=unclassified Brenneria TaxID=2634434 RepID=UPI001553208B|nr:hypothetical protein [Brenneria sp. hezel4-2-4]MEE3649467.1 hypothetical protein [Brenneria sp. HEZEL_4_2_4]NPC99424.1 hypothetical protein [Brenneria sp. hezel4-2-4]
MKENLITIEKIYSIAHDYFPKGHTRVEIWDIGLKFVNQTAEGEKTAFLQRELNLIDETSIRGFLDAEIES